MQIKNIDTTLRKTMVAVFTKSGMSDAAAVAKADKHIESARATFFESKAKSDTTPPRSDLDHLRARARGAALSSDKNKKAGGKAGAPGKAGKNAQSRKGPFIKTSSKKITSAEQVALAKVRDPRNRHRFLLTKASASIAIALGAVATWAKTLPVDPSPPVIPQDPPADTQPDPAPDAAPEPATPDPSKNKKSFRGSARRDPR